MKSLPRFKLRQTSLLIVERYKRRYWSWKSDLWVESQIYFVFFSACQLGFVFEARREWQWQDSNMYIRTFLWDIEREWQEIAEWEKKNKKRDYINLLSWIMSEKLKRIRRFEVEHDKWMGRMDHWYESVKTFSSKAFNLRVWRPFQRERRLFPPIQATMIIKQPTMILLHKNCLSPHKSLSLNFRSPIECRKHKLLLSS